VVINNRNRVVKPCGRKPLRAGKRTPTSRTFLLPPVSYCNLEIVLCQGFENIFPLLKYLGAINKEKGSVRNCLRSHKCLEEGYFL
jgi:hypothetical protein